MSMLVKKRIKAIDQFRGFSIICMVLINYGVNIQTVPAWLKHDPDIGLKFADFGAPAFIFTIGLTFGLSFQRRSDRDGISSAIGHFTRRYLVFLGIGAIISAGQTMLGFNASGVDWGVLQAIGCAGLMTLAVIYLPSGARLIFGLGLLTAYQILLNSYWAEMVLRSPHGGLAGALSWAALLIISTFFGDLFHNKDRRKFFPYLSILFLAGGFFISSIVPISKSLGSASYILITLGTSGLVFSMFYIMDFQLRFFSAWGQNPISLYLISFLLTGLFVLPGIPTWHEQAPLWLVGLQAMSLLLVLSKLALYWQKRNIIFSI